MTHSASLIRFFSFSLALSLAAFLSGCRGKVEYGSALEQSVSHRISRYSLSQYNPYPLSNFVVSYDLEDKPTAIFFKSASLNGSSLETINLSYESGRVALIQTSAQNSERFDYNLAGKLQTIFYTTTKDTGRLSFSYDKIGHLVVYTDSVRKPLQPVQRTRFVASYDEKGNVSRLSEFFVDANGVSDLRFVSDFGYDGQINAFAGLQIFRKLSEIKGGFFLPINVNNIVSYRRRYLNFADLGRGVRATVPDTLLSLSINYMYSYNSNGRPTVCNVDYKDFLNMSTGTYQFKFDY